MLAQPAVVGQRDGEERGDGQPAQPEFLVVRGILATPVPLGEPPADRVRPQVVGRLEPEIRGVRAAHANQRACSYGHDVDALAVAYCIHNQRDGRPMRCCISHAYLAQHCRVSEASSQPDHGRNQAVIPVRAMHGAAVRTEVERAARGRGRKERRANLGLEVGQCTFVPVAALQAVEQLAPGRRAGREILVRERDNRRQRHVEIPSLVLAVLQQRNHFAQVLVDGHGPVEDRGAGALRGEANLGLDGRNRASQSRREQGSGVGSELGGIARRLGAIGGVLRVLHFRFHAKG